MKKLIYLVVLAIGAIGCSVEEHANTEIQEVNLIEEAERCGAATTHDYLDNDGTVLGDVEVTNDATTLYVKISSSTENGLKNAHLAWAETFEDFGATPGTLPVGKMTKADDIDVTSYTFEVSLNEIASDCILIAARAIFPANEGNHWAGDEIAGQAEWRYFQYCIQECVITPPPPVIVCESAYAMSEINKTLVSYYNERTSSQNWGWFNYVNIEENNHQDLDIYAAAGQNIIENGTYVGFVRVYYNGTTTFHPADNFSFSNTHIYLGEQMPTKRLAPGHFARNSTAVSDGDFFVIVHLEVCAEEEFWN